MLIISAKVGQSRVESWTGCTWNWNTTQSGEQDQLWQTLAYRPSGFSHRHNTPHTYKDFWCKSLRSVIYLNTYIMLLFILVIVITEGLFSYCNSAISISFTDHHSVNCATHTPKTSNHHSISDEHFSLLQGHISPYHRSRFWVNPHPTSSPPTSFPFPPPSSALSAAPRGEVEAQERIKLASFPTFSWQTALSRSERCLPVFAWFQLTSTSTGH